jgi:hypothetical protein
MVSRNPTSPVIATHQNLSRQLFSSKVTSAMEGECGERTYRRVSSTNNSERQGPGVDSRGSTDVSEKPSSALTVRRVIASLRQCMWVFCWPPCPSKIASKVAFFPPKSPSYKFVPRRGSPREFDVSWLEIVLCTSRRPTIDVIQWTIVEIIGEPVQFNYFISTNISFDKGYNHQASREDHCMDPLDEDPRCFRSTNK